MPKLMSDFAACGKGENPYHFPASWGKKLIDMMGVDSGTLAHMRVSTIRANGAVHAWLPAACLAQGLGTPGIDHPDPEVSG